MIIDNQSFKDAYTDYFEIVCRFLNYYTRDYQAIEEVVQDVFVNLWIDYEGKEIRFVKTFPLSQEGKISFKYRLTPHMGAYNVVDATRFGLEQFRPLIVVQTKNKFKQPYCSPTQLLRPVSAVLLSKRTGGGRAESSV